VDKRRVFFVVRAALLAAFAACAGGRAGAQGENGPESPLTLYAAGYERNGGGESVAMVWKISGSTVTPLVLTDGTQPAEVVGIAENGGSIYVRKMRRAFPVPAQADWEQVLRLYPNQTDARNNFERLRQNGY
jgi:hypothetical protein